MQPCCQISGQKSLTKNSDGLSWHVMAVLQWNFKFYHFFFLMFLRSPKAGRNILQSSCDCCYSLFLSLHTLVNGSRKKKRKQTSKNKTRRILTKCLECIASGLLRLDSVVETSSHRSGGLGPLQCLAQHRGGLEGTQLSGPRRLRRRQSVLVALGLLRMPGKAW